MDLYLFLLIMSPLAFIYSVSGQEQPRKNCDVKTRNIQENVCCQGEKYAFLGFYRQKSQESCNVEPKTEGLSLQDSVWLAFDCHVRAWLNGTELTKQSFVTWISQLPQSKQNKLWVILSTDDQIHSETAEDEMTKIHKIKSYFFEYLQAVLKICSSELPNDDASASEEKRIWRKLTYSLVNCSSGPLPEFLHYYFVGGYSRYKNCTAGFSKFLGNSTNADIFRKQSIFCESISPDFSINELGKEDLDFQTVLNYKLPKFWSKSTKEIARENVLQRLSFKLECNTTKVEEVIPKLWVTIDESMAIFQGGNVTLDRSMIQTLRNLHFGAFVSSILETEKHEMCSPS